MKQIALSALITLPIYVVSAFPHKGIMSVLGDKYMTNYTFKDLTRQNETFIIARETNHIKRAKRRSLEEDGTIKDKLNLAIDFFVILLKNLISEDGLDKIGFNLSVINLKRQLSEISSRYQTVIPRDISLSRKYRHASSMFHVMNQSVELLGFYIREGPAHRLTRNMIELNIILLALHDSFGLPDFKRPAFAETVMRLRILCIHWKVAFDKLDEVPESAGLMFESRWLRAERTLEYLEGYIPGVKPVSFLE